jgi:hypothetical protein
MLAEDLRALLVFGRFPKIASQRIAITAPKMTVLSVGHFAKLGVWRVPKYPAASGRRRVPKRHNRTVYLAATL